MGFQRLDWSEEGSLASIVTRSIRFTLSIRIVSLGLPLKISRTTFTRSPSIAERTSRHFINLNPRDSGPEPLFPQLRASPCDTTFTFLQSSDSPLFLPLLTILRGFQPLLNGFADLMKARTPSRRSCGPSGRFHVPVQHSLASAPDHLVQGEGVFADSNTGSISRSVPPLYRPSWRACIPGLC